MLLEFAGNRPRAVQNSTSSVESDENDDKTFTAVLGATEHNR